MCLKTKNLQGMYFTWEHCCSFFLRTKILTTLSFPVFFFLVSSFKMFIVSSFTWTYCGKIWFSMTYHDFGRLTLLKDWVRVLHKRNKHKSIFFVLEHHGLSLFFSCFDDIGSHHIETSPLICRANQRTGFYLIGTSVMKELLRTFSKISEWICVAKISAANYFFKKDPS